jgi:hypothetical protein
MEFTEFPKMPRLSRGMIITEKIDGTNGQIVITESGDYNNPYNLLGVELSREEGLLMFAGGRTRWITPTDDNAGFARWCQSNREELLKLGIGRHFGEWWGQGIQRNYGLKEKRFSLFNVGRWADPAVRPECCGIVPVLSEGYNFDTIIIGEVLSDLRMNGSTAAPGFMNPEGVVVWHTAGNFGLKKTLEKDEVPKSLAKV